MKQKPETLGKLLREATLRLETGGVVTAAQDARRLLQHAGAFSRNEIITHENDRVSDECAVMFEQLVLRRLGGEPANRIIGAESFYGRCFEIDASTLVPRQDTESVVECALGLLAHRSENARVLDLGTGSGIVAITLACERPEIEVYASDISPMALSVAQRNARAHKLAERITWLEGDLFEPSTGKYDLVISNPPYIRSSDIGSLDREVREFDPLLALDGGLDGLKFYRRIFCEAGAHLKENGLLVLEFGYDQALSVTQLAEDHGFGVTQLITDLAGKQRGIVAKLKAN